MLCSSLRNLPQVCCGYYKKNGSFPSCFYHLHQLFMCNQFLIVSDTSICASKCMESPESCNMFATATNSSGDHCQFGYFIDGSSPPQVISVRGIVVYISDMILGKLKTLSLILVTRTAYSLQWLLQVVMTVNPRWESPLTTQPLRHALARLVASIKIKG